MAKAAKKAAKISPASPVKQAVPKTLVKKGTSATGKTPVKKAAAAKPKAPAKKTAFATVDAFIAAQDKAVANTLMALRKIMLGADKTVGEQVKWNSPAYYYTGDMKTFDPKDYKRDIAVVNLNRKEYLLLIFPTGARIKDTSGLLEGSYPDGRRMVKITDEDDLKAKAKGLQQIVKEWLKGVEK